MKSSVLIVSLVLLVSFGCQMVKEDFDYVRPNHVNSNDKITGVNLEMPRQQIEQSDLDSINKMNAGWVSLIPYAFSEKDSARVQFGHNWQWWGETEEGCVAISSYAKAAGQKVMIKPHVWVMGDGWPGEFDLDTEEEWNVWETSYREYILHFAHVADSVGAEIYCIGTECRNAAAKREQFWRELIQDVREVYKGEVTYAANWDNYEKVKFWDALDYIGIDAYFPTSKKRTPAIADWQNGWKEVREGLQSFSSKYDKKILFTEYGFKSADFAGAGTLSGKNKPGVNQRNQFNAYKVFYETIWTEDFIAGGFIWKWCFRPRSGVVGEANVRYTPQDKPAFEVIRQVYGAKN